MTEYVLYHSGIKGMKWGIRRFQKPNGTLTPAGRKRYADALDGGQSSNKKTYNKSAKSKSGSKSVNTKSNNERRGLTDKQKKALKVGAAVVGTALAVYGTYKLASYMQDKRSQAAMQKAQDYIKDNFYNKVGERTFKDGAKTFHFETSSGGAKLATKGTSEATKYIDQHNEKVMNTAKGIYANTLNTRVDRGLSKVVNAGDAVGNTAKRAATSAGNAAKSAGNTAKRAATKAKNSVLDVVNPVYEYTPRSTSTTSKVVDGVTIKKAVTTYDKIKKRRR